MSSSEFKKLQVAVIGGGIGGLSAAIALRQAGHRGEFWVFVSRNGERISAYF